MKVLTLVLEVLNFLSGWIPVTSYALAAFINILPTHAWCLLVHDNFPAILDFSLATTLLFCGKTLFILVIKLG